MAESKRSEFKGFYEQGLNLDESSSQGLFNPSELRPTTLKREALSFSAFSEPTVYRSLLDQPELRPTTLYRSSNINDSDLSRPDYRSIIDSTIHSGSDIVPPSKIISSKSSYVSRVSPIIDDFRSSALSKDLPKEPPPVPGGYLEPFYHLISRAKPSSLLDVISQAILSLQKQKAISYGIDMDIVHRKYKVKCIAYPLGEPKVPFVCRVFLMDFDEQGKRYAVEFQRRSGCVLQFSDLWAKCKRYFQESGLFIQDKNSLPSKSPLAKLAVQVTDTQFRETLKCLLQMATSKCCDVKSQAVAALCKMSTEEQYQTLMIEEEGCLEAFIAAVGCPDEDVHRCAVSALANLAHSRADVCRKITEKNGVERLCTLSNSRTKEIVRESLRALLLLTQTLGSNILDDGCHRVMENHRNSQDPFTQQAVQHLIKLSV